MIDIELNYHIKLMSAFEVFSLSEIGAISLGHFHIWNMLKEFASGLSKVPVSLVSVQMSITLLVEFKHSVSESTTDLESRLEGFLSLEFVLLNPTVSRSNLSTSWAEVSFSDLSQLLGWSGQLHLI
jgi:hypothetical protein